MPDATASSTDRSQEVDSVDRSRDVGSQEVDSKGTSRDVDANARSREGHSRGRPQVVEVACPHCDRPTTVPVSNARAEVHVRPSVASFGEYSTVHCAAGHEFWIYCC